MSRTNDVPASRGNEAGRLSSLGPAAGAGTRRWEWVALAAVLVLAGVAYGWDLDRNGWANAYYSAAAQAGATSWRAMFFGSLEARNAVATDKPPVALWVIAASVRLWGLSPVSVMLPQVLQGVLSVLVLHRTVRRLGGPRSATVAAVVLATTPVFFVLARFNDPDTTLTLLLLCATYGIVRCARSRSRGRAWAVAAGWFIGAAFLTKWMAALLPVPALLAYLLLHPHLPVKERRTRAGAVLASALVAGLWWPVLLWVLPAGARPFQDASGGSVWNLVFGSDGVSRLASATVTRANATSGAPGPLRLLAPPFDTQVGWLVPLALAALIVPWVLRRAGLVRRTGRDSYLLWGGWLLLGSTAFSLMSGAMHPYYTVLLAPAVAALIGLACSDLADAWDEPLARLLGTALLALGGAYTLTVLGTGHREPGWVSPMVTVCLAVAMLLLVVPATRAQGPQGPLLRGAAMTAVAVSLLTGPTVFAVATLGRPVTGANPLAGPAPSVIVAPYDQALVNFLEAQPEGRWMAAVPTATAAARLQLQSGDPVLPLGGFTGHAGSPTVAQVQAWARQGRLRYIVLAGPYATHPSDDPAPLAHSNLAALIRWARAHACVRSVPGTTVRVIDLHGTCLATTSLASPGLGTARA